MRLLKREKLQSKNPQKNKTDYYLVNVALMQRSVIKATLKYNSYRAFVVSVVLTTGIQLYRYDAVEEKKPGPLTGLEQTGLTVSDASFPRPSSSSSVERNSLFVEP